jgi:peptidase M28-like protein
LGRFAVLCWISTLAFSATRSPLSPIIQKVSAEVDVDRAMQTMRTVYSTDRWFTFPKFEATAVYLRDRLKQSGLENIELAGAPADGVTQAGFWTMPLAWDVKQARLEMVEPERETLCDYASVPTSLGMWSGPAPEGGVTAELVDIAKTPWPEVKGKLVLTEKISPAYKFQLAKYGALGAVNGFSENPSLADGRQWINAWGDNGWGFTKASTPLLSYSVTPRQAAHLRQLLASGKKVVLQAVAETRYYSGRYPYVTATLPGTNPGEEVLVLGHTSEQGAQDNATGVAAMTEAMNTLSRLVREGKLPRPPRTIRILLMPEMYGSLSYISRNPERMRHTVAAMTVDTPASSYDLAGTEYTFYMNPQVAMSYTDSLVQRIASEYLAPLRPWYWKEHMPGTDSYLGEPTIGVPTDWPYSGTGPVTHHNSEDKPEKVDPRSLKDVVVTIATYLYFNAEANEEHVPWLAQLVLDHVQQEMAASVETAMDAIRSGDSVAGSYGLDRVCYLADRGADAIRSVLRVVSAERRPQCQSSLQPVLAQTRELRDLELERLRSAGATASQHTANPEAEKIIVKRKRIGTIPLDDLPQDQWHGYPSGAWDTTVIVALYWCDGTRNLSQVIHLTQMELGPSRFDFLGYFRFLEKHGYVEFAN